MGDRDISICFLQSFKTADVYDINSDRHEKKYVEFFCSEIYTLIIEIKKHNLCSIHNGFYSYLSKVLKKYLSKNLSLK